jgi:hypothetical protein
VGEWDEKFRVEGDKISKRTVAFCLLNSYRVKKRPWHGSWLRRLLTGLSRRRPGWVHVGFRTTKWHWDGVFSEFFDFPLSRDSLYSHRLGSEQLLAAVQRHQQQLKVLLHVWGSLGSVTLALLQQCTSKTLLRSLDTQQYWTALVSLADNNVNKQHCYARNNRQAFPRSQDCCFRTSTDVFSVFWKSLQSRRACVWLRTSFGWKIKFVSGKCERNTWVYTVDVGLHGLRPASIVAYLRNATMFY